MKALNARDEEDPQNEETRKPDGVESGAIGAARSGRRHRGHRRLSRPAGSCFGEEGKKMNSRVDRREEDEQSAPGNTLLKTIRRLII